MRLLFRSDRAEEIALDVGGERLERRDIEGMEPVRGIRSEIDKARQKARERLARAGCRDEQRMLAALRYREHLGLMPPDPPARSEEHTSELQSLMRTSYAVFCLKKKKKHRKCISHQN